MTRQSASNTLDTYHKQRGISQMTTKKQLTLEDLREEIRVSFARFQGAMDANFANVQRDITDLRKDIREFYVTLRQHDERLDRLEHPEDREQ